MPDESKHTWPGISSIDAGTAASPPGSGIGALRYGVRMFWCTDSARDVRAMCAHSSPVHSE
eukprot:1773840-Prymnesium_polylepis.1